MFFLVTDAFAQAAAPAAGGDSPASGLFGGQWSFPLMMGLMFAIMYFIVIRPQQQEKKKLQKMIDALKKGDRVLTTSGIYATVVGVDGTKVVLKIADEVKVEFARSAIAQVIVAESK